MASTKTVQQLINGLRTYPEVKAYMDVSGFASEPALTIANSVIQRMLAQSMDWKWNRANVPAFVTISLQQDYVTNVTNMGWFESGSIIDINNTTVPKPRRALESVRDLPPTSWQDVPFNFCWIPNSLAVMGTWQASTAYGCGYGQPSPPSSPITQFIDANSNILFINSSSLNLSINSPGYSNTPISTTPPFGTSGTVQPLLAANSVAGATVVDGTVTWTVADPNGYAVRVSPLPAFSGLCWLVNAVYQKKPPDITALTQTISPIPDDMAYLFQQGFLAMLYEHSPDPGAARKAPASYAKWEEALMTALRGADREQEEACLYPSDSMGGGSGGFPLGPAFPYSPNFW